MLAAAPRERSWLKSCVLHSAQNLDGVFMVLS